MKDNRNSRGTSAAEWLTAFLFFLGMGLIAAGLYQFSRALALVFLGIACLYLAFGVYKTAKSSGKDGKQ